MTDAIVQAHGLGARALILFAVVVAIWGTYLYFRKGELNGGFRSSYLVMTGLTALQGLAGLVLLATGRWPAAGFLHFVYGVFAVLFLPGVYLYAQGGSRRREAVLLAGATWVVSIAYFRGVATG
jgi:hypothetical protein